MNDKDWFLDYAIPIFLTLAIASLLLITIWVLVTDKPDPLRRCRNIINIQSCANTEEGQVCKNWQECGDKN